ncbi:hypothetical protein NQ314_006266 [Rhamnusium bicolor]|uniref:Senescence domain-containing protein n=1 Tax=Rhamnusium bicolor TaxID=1586634 RepID=A0AAV8Z7N5_9CUCU|nr:hypothetical protein NQ314_006266 [Rhamnusium bicolor]
MSGSKEMGNVRSLDPRWSETYSAIKNKHDAAFLAIDQAISLEEREKPNEMKHLLFKCSVQKNPDITWEKACVMIQKIKKTRAEVLTRISSIQRSPDFVPDVSPEDPPSYEEAIASSVCSDDIPLTYKDLATALNDLSIDPNQNVAEELIYTHDSVRLYFISPNGEIKLRYVLYECPFLGDGPDNPKAILQIGNWVYPLVPGVSPCYRTDYGAFILPNVYAEIPGSSVGIILPSDADQEVFDLLENILHGIISQATEEQIRAEKRLREEEDLSSKISSKIVDGAWYLSQGLVKGAEKASEFFNSSTPKIINNLQVSEEPAHIPRPLSKSMQIAETATNKAAKVTGFVADQVGMATMRLGQFLAPHIQKQGTRLLATGFKMSEQEASDKMKGVLRVAAGAVEGFSTVYRGLETSASILASNLKENTVKIVEHKYGHPAGTFTGDTLTTMGNVYTISHNTRIITPKGLVKRTAKSTSQAIICGHTTSSCKASTSHQNDLNHPNDKIKGSDSSSSLSKDDKDGKKGLE